jgi:hypothetical protein
LNYIRQLIQLVDVTDDLWTNDLIEILTDFLRTNRQLLLIVYFDTNRSLLHVEHSIPIDFMSMLVKQSFYYFIRRNDSIEYIASIDEFLQHVRFGYVHGQAMTCLTSLLSTLFGPLVMDDMTIQDSEPMAIPL